MLMSLVCVSLPASTVFWPRTNKLQFLAGLIGASQAKTYPALMGTRVLHAFGSGVCEALPVQLVNDIFFLHERGKRIGYYTGM
jgi:MFS family permease